MDPKDRNPNDPDDFGPGMSPGGDVKVMTPEEAAVARSARDAFDETFDADEDDLSDLDDIDFEGDDHL